MDWIVVRSDDRFYQYMISTHAQCRRYFQRDDSVWVNNPSKSTIQYKLYSTHEYLFGVMLISGWKSAIQWSIFQSWSLFFGAFHWEGQLAGVATWYPGNPMEVVSPLIPLSYYMLYQYFNLRSNPSHNPSLNGTHNMSHTICRQLKQEGFVLVKQGPASQVKANLRSPRRAGQQPAWTAN